LKKDRFMAAKSQSKEAELASDTQLLAGMQKDLGATASLTIAGQTMTSQQAMTVVQGRIATANAVPPAKAAYAKAVAANDAQLAQTKQFMSALRQLLLAMFVTQPDKLADFGLSPRKVAKRTAVSKMVAAEKNLATRKERGTMPKEDKLLIKGVLAPVISVSTAPGGTVLTASAESNGNAPVAMTATAASPSSNGTGTPPAHGG
jgi:hypothetical protein